KKYSELEWVARYLIEGYKRVGEDDKAAEVLVEQVPVVRKHLFENSPQLCGFLESTGSELLQLKKWGQAEPLLRQSLAIREKPRPDDWYVYNSQSLLGASRLGQKKYAEAEPLLLKGYEGLKRREKTIPPGDGGNPRRPGPRPLDRAVHGDGRAGRGEEV